MTSISKTIIDTKLKGHLALETLGSCAFTVLAGPQQTRMNPEDSVWNYAGVVN